MQAKLSPTPWRVNGHGEIVDAEGHSIAIITGYGRTIDQMLSDAALMAEAPFLLQGLKDIFAMMDGDILVRNTEGDHKDDFTMRIVDVVQKLKAVREAMIRAERKVP